MTEPIGLAVVGAGAWGKNLLRAFAGISGCEVRWVCDLDEARLADARRRYPGIRTTPSFDDLLEEQAVRAMVIATPAPSHAPLARQALEGDRDVFVEKPLALCSGDARALCELAEARGRVLMAGHLLVHHPAVRYLKALIDRGELGDIHYLYSLRVNLGRVRSEENALWSFAPHDLSVIDLLVGERPCSVACRGASYLQPGIEDVVFLNLDFPGGVMAQVQLSWLDPHKMRRLTVVGSRKMAVFDDVHPSDKIWLYDKGVISHGSAQFESYAEYLSIRDGDTLIPRIEMREPLVCEAGHFIDRVRDRKPPASSGWDGLRVVEVLQAAQRSMEQGGMPTGLTTEGPREES